MSNKLAAAVVVIKSCTTDVWVQAVKDVHNKDVKTSLKTKLLYIVLVANLISISFWLMVLMDKLEV